ncbi:UNVERIFIED_CONTAM: hypothetical protein FKN15_001559 [Acipenser sinensis]
MSPSSSFLPPLSLPSLPLFSVSLFLFLLLAPLSPLFLFLAPSLSPLPLSLLDVSLFLFLAPSLSPLPPSLLDVSLFLFLAPSLSPLPPSHLYVSLLAPPALKLSVDETLVVNPGDNVTMSCLVTGGIPTPVISWTHYPGPMPTTARVQGGTVTLQNVKVQDSGYYNCTAVNNVGNPAKKTVNLIVRAMSNITFQITPDPNKDSETIQMEQDVKLSCHVDAQPQDKVNYTWYKNGLPVRPSKTLVILRNDPELDPGTCSLEIFYMNFRDQATYSCVASFTGTPIPELKIEVNLTRNTVVPPVLTVPKDRATVMVREGSRVELQCDVSGKPRPPVLWSRADKELPMPSGDWLVETRDGRLRLDNVTRDMSGSYRCQTARFNGLNIKPRQALVQLNVQFAPIVEPQSLDVRTRTGDSVTLRCIMLKANPQRIASSTWRLNGRLIRSARPELQDYSEWQIDSFSQLSNGTYECSISNDVGTSICVFYVSGESWTQREPEAVDVVIGYKLEVRQHHCSNSPQQLRLAAALHVAKAYNPDFYYDTPAPIKKDNRNYSYTLQWTQREPEAVDVVIGYKLEVRQHHCSNSPQQLRLAAALHVGENPRYGLL